MAQHIARYAALSLALGTALFAPGAHGQTTEPQQAPAPVVRVRPRPQTSVPVNAPPDAAPLVNRAPRPRPVNPQALSGATAPTGVTATSGQTSPRPAMSGTTTARPPQAASAPGSAARPAPVPSHPAATAASGAAAATHTAAAGNSGSTGSTGPAATASATPKLNFSTGVNRTVIVLDPAHGGTDSGSRIGDNILEKNVTLALAFRLRSLLVARGFTVVLTRDGDAPVEPNNPSNPLTLDDRAGIANHFRPAACLLLHATGRGNGVHLYSSELNAATGETPEAPWLTAQAAWVPASQQLEHSISTALGRSHISLVSNMASIRPLDSLACPALVLELAPESSDPRAINDSGYQDRVAAAIAGALVFWQNQVQPPPRLSLNPTSPHTARHHTATPPKESQP